MKFALSLLLAGLPLLAAAIPQDPNEFAFGGGNRGGKGGQGGQGNGGATTTTNAAAATTANAAASTTTAAAAGSGDPQASLTLLSSVIATGFANDGQDNATAGQVASLTSTNNYINFCATVPNLPITNGQQIKTGSCNPAPMGIIAASTNMPSCKFQFPANGDTSIQANTAFTVQLAINHLQTGHFTNAQETYYSAPQVVNSAGDIVGHSHIVIQAMTALDQTTPLDPATFAFFKGIDGAAVNGVLSVPVTAGLPAGFYKMSTINSAANHQPVLVAIAQHGDLDDTVYFTVGGGGGNGNNNAGAGNGAATTTAAATTAAATTTAAAGGNGGNGGQGRGQGGQGRGGRNQRRRFARESY